MTRKITLLFVFVLMVAPFAFVTAQDSQQPPDQTNPPTTGTMAPTTPVVPEASSSLSGVVDKIDLKKNTISIKNESTNAVTVYNFNEMSAFSRDEKPLKSSDLKKGQRVSFVSDSQNMVSTLKIEPKATDLKPPHEQQKKH